jgi:hypothetical protein
LIKVWIQFYGTFQGIEKEYTKFNVFIPCVPYIGMKIIIDGLSLTVADYHLDFDYCKEIVIIHCEDKVMEDFHLEYLESNDWK